MALAKMSEADRRIIFECLTAAACGPFFSDAALPILFGLHRHEFLEFVGRIPIINDSEPNVRRAIGDTLSNLLRYPHGKGDEWSNWLSASPKEVEQIYVRWHAFQARLVYESFDIFGPACFGGRYYRVVGYQVHGGGRGWGCEVWCSGQWLLPTNGPGVPAIMAANPVSPEELHQAGVDNSTLSKHYDPLCVALEDSLAGIDKDVKRVAN